VLGGGFVALLVATGCASGTTDPPADVTDKAATLRAHGSAGGDPTDYWFEYGPTESYGSATPHRSGGSGTGEVSVSERITGLAPDTLYHYRACASNQGGAGCTNDVTFRTGSLGLLPGFQETTAFSGLTEPTTLRFSPDGRVFVAEKSGLIKVFDGLDDPTPDVFADLRTEVHNFWDRGLLGMTLDPSFPAKPFVYVLYTLDAAIGGTPPRWGTVGGTFDGCPNPPGATSNGCVVSGRLARLTAEGNHMAGGEQVLIEDWCQQFPSHSIGDLEFGNGGALFVSGGDGANFDIVEYGQLGTPRNPCADPPSPAGTALSPPSAEGGALRSQDLRTPGDPTTLDGAVLRVNRTTGEAYPNNPMAGSPDLDARRIIAYGLRNPFRMVARPGTNDLWVGDVGWVDWEEINRIPSPTDAVVENFGWPCFEGTLRQGGYDGADLSLCEGLYSGGGATAPRYRYNHFAKVFAEESCPVGSSSISGMAFPPIGSTLPAEFDGALFFADYARGCIWVMERNGGVLPSNARIRTFRAGAAAPVDLQFGPGNDLFYVDFANGRVRRIHYTEGNQPPRAVAGTNRTDGGTPLTVNFNASGSSDPDPGDTLSYAWDLDGDGAYDDAATPDASFEYTAAGSYLVGLRVTDDHGAAATDTVAITAGNTPPTAAIETPTPGFTWGVGDTIAFTGSATDAQDGDLDATRLSWSAVLQHCPSNCHPHTLQSFPNTDHGSFPAIDHEYPSYIELRLTARDSGGLTDVRTIRLDPKTVKLSFGSSPSGLLLTVNSGDSATPFTRTVIQGSANSISAPTPQTLAGATYDFGSWSDGGARTHTITAPTDRSLTATYSRR
jgi:glucose/arabinose dehydrogenase